MKPFTMKQFAIEFVKIVRRREYFGFVIGAAVVFAAYELSGMWQAAIIICAILFGFELAQKYGL